MPKQRSGYVAALLAALVGFGLRVWKLGDASIWWDEGLAVWASRMPLAQMAAWTASDVHPPLYFVLLHYWRQAVGDGEFAVRYLSVIAGTLAVAAVVHLARRLWPCRWTPAVIAGFVWATSRFAVWWSQEARMYMLAALWVTLSLAFTVALARRWRWSLVVAWWFVTTAAPWTLYLAAFVLLVESLYWGGLILQGAGPSTRRRDLIRWVGLMAASLLAFAPWVAYAVTRTRSWSVNASFDGWTYVALYATLLTVGISTHVERWARVGIPVFLGVLALAGWTSNRRRADIAAAGLLWLTLLIPPAVVWALTAVPRSFGYVPKPEARYLLPFAAAFAVLVGWVAATLRHRWQRAGIAGLVLAVNLVGLVHHYPGRYLLDDYKSLSATLRAYVRPGDVVVLHTDAAWPIFAYHWPFPFVGTPSGQDATPGGAEYFLKPLWEAHEGLWLVVDEDALRVDPQRYFEAWLRERALGVREWRYSRKRLILFARTPARAKTLAMPALTVSPPAPPEPLETPSWRLVGWEQALHRVRGGDVAYLALWVEARAPVTEPIVVRAEAVPHVQATVALPGREGLSRLEVAIRVPPNVPAVSTRWVVETADGLQVPEGRVTFFPRSLTFGGPGQPRVRVDYTYGDPPLVRLVGYTVDDVGEYLKVTLFWHVLGTTATDYKVFVHVTETGGRVVTQRDAYPRGGELPTTAWTPGLQFADEYLIPWKDVPPGKYLLKVGLYDPVTGERLRPVRDQAGMPQPDNQAVLTELMRP